MPKIALWKPRPKLLKHFQENVISLFFNNTFKPRKEPLSIGNDLGQMERKVAGHGILSGMLDLSQDNCGKGTC